MGIDGIELGFRSAHGPRLRYEFSADDDRKIILGVNTGAYDSEIARAVGCTEKALAGRIILLRKYKFLDYRAKARQPGNWSKERNDKLAALYAGHHSFNEMARLLDFSKSAVLRQVQLLRLPNPGPKPKRKKTTTRSAGHKQLQRRSAVTGLPISQHQAAKYRERRDIMAPPPLRDDMGAVITLETLKYDGQCRWPHGTPGQGDFHFCANPCSGTYCDYHSQRASTRSVQPAVTPC